MEDYTSLEDNIENLGDHVLGDGFSNMTQKHDPWRKKLKLDFIKLNFSALQNTLYGEWKHKPQIWENIVKHLYDKMVKPKLKENH